MSIKVTSDFSKDAGQKEVKEYAFSFPPKTQMSIDRWIDGQILVYLHNKMLLNNKK